MNNKQPNKYVLINYQKKSGYFELRKALVKIAIFRVKIPIKRNRLIFACICKGLEVDPDHVFHDPKKLRKKYSKKVSDLRNSFDWI